jgi:hypothetical protein
MQCNQCQSPFEITDNDKKFYQKIKVPEPTLCPPCRQQRRLAFRNERNLFKRKCDLTGKDIISTIHPDSPFKVYENSLWYSDQWDGLDYGRDFDFNRPFFEQFAELHRTVPRISLGVISNENSPYVNQAWKSKDCHMCFDLGFGEDVYYSDCTYYCKKLVDGSFVWNSEFSYWLVDCHKCINCFYLQDCQGCYNAYFSYDCQNCENIAFCSNLRNKKNYVFNKPVSPEEFNQILDNIKAGSYQRWEKCREIYKNKVVKNAIHKHSNNINTENCEGNYISFSKNCDECYEIETCEDCKFVTRSDEKTVSCMDLDHCTMSELNYEGTCIMGFNNHFVLNSYSPNNSNCLYSDTIISSSDLFGCVGLRNKQYCILNKQYSMDEYYKVAPKIIEHMQSTGEWGEFFPVELSPFAYNESYAMEYYPMTEDEVKARGWIWRKSDDKNYLPATCSLPDMTISVADDILKETLACEKCGRNYRIIAQELEFYRNQKLPLPRHCYFCRHDDRMSMRNPRKLFDRKCDKCQKEIRSSYSAEREEKVYCEQCYLSEIY